KIFLTCDALAFLALGFNFLALKYGFFSPLIALITSFEVATCQAFVGPTINKAVVKLVPESKVSTAVSFVASTDSLANFGGAVFGAVLISILGINLAVGVSALGYIFSFIVNMFIRYRYSLPPTVVNNLPPQEAENISFCEPMFKKEKVLMKLIFLFGLINFFATPTLVILPMYTKFTLKAEASTLAWLEASLWGGMLIGSFLSKKLFSWQRPFWMGLGCISVFGFMMFIPALWVNERVYMFALCVSGFCLGVNNVGFMSLFQVAVNDDEKGRFFAMLQAVVGFSFPIAFFFFGCLVDYLNPQQVLWIQGLGVLGMSVFGFRNLLEKEQEFLMGIGFYDDVTI
ncbi:MAG: MFS transporter, partial [Deltaproteobacteria bacterium]|nr:MFS transporter [Deltaproteobacteria bacterium]